MERSIGRAAGGPARFNQGAACTTRLRARVLTFGRSGSARTELNTLVDLRGRERVAYRPAKFCLDRLAARHALRKEHVDALDRSEHGTVRQFDFDDRSFFATRLLGLRQEIAGCQLGVFGQNDAAGELAGARICEARCSHGARMDLAIREHHGNRPTDRELRFFRSLRDARTKTNRITVGLNPNLAHPGPGRAVAAQYLDGLERRVRKRTARVTLPMDAVRQDPMAADVCRPCVYCRLHTGG